MGHRANIAIITSAPGYELYDSHWGANRLDGDLFWGPAEALEFAREQRSRAEGAAWLDEVWAEGGALLDTTRRELLWFGGESVRDDVPLRRMHLRLMRELWAGWTITWASGGVADLARRVGEPLDTVLAPTTEAPRSGELVLCEPAEPDWISGVISIRRASGDLRFFALDGFDQDLARRGPALASAVLRAPLHESFDYAARSPAFPTGGLHVDEAARRVELWLGRDAPDCERRLAEAWPGWSIAWHADRFEAQLERCDGRLAFPIASDAALVESVRQSVLRAARGSTAEIDASALPDEERADRARAHANAFAGAARRVLAHPYR